MNLTGWPLVALVGAATVAAPVVAVLVWRRSRDRVGGGVLRTVGRWSAVLGCQVLAVSLTFLVVNNDFGFYSSWGDLFGTSSTVARLTTQNLVRPGDGRVEVMDVPDQTGGTLPVLVWLPPQYDQPAYSQAKFPVTVVLPGQPSNPQAMFRHFNFGAEATQAIEHHLAKPFIAVFPPLMTNPPRDTECTDIPHGPQAETWLTTGVRNAVLKQARASTDPGLWSAMGYSTGAFCAVKLVLSHPRLFAAAVGFGGYYQPITDRTTGNLFGGSKIRYDENSPLWLYGRRGLAPGHRLLLISGQQDTESWAETQKMLQATRGDPAVAALTFDVGGHNYRNYRDAVPQTLQWLGHHGYLG